MRADRLLSILMLLEVHRRMPARDLAHRLEVSERTIHRDMEALSAAGIPVYAERGTGGGWSLMEEYRTNLTGLSEAEVQVLFMSRPAHLMADLGLEKVSEAARIKLLAALPSLQRHDAEFVRQRIYIDTAGWRRAEESVPWLRTLQDALWQEHKLHITYGYDEDSVFEREVEPLGLVARGSIWYMVAAVDAEPRTYRVTRIRNARVLDEHATRPIGFDLAAYWEASKEQFVAGLPRFPVVVRTHADVVPQLRMVGRFSNVEQVGPADDEGRVVVSMRFEIEEDALAAMFSLGPRVELLEPAGLRESIRAVAAQMLALYSEK
jgi:predicted DNA-binding transcriptional regulator YafY